MTKVICPKTYPSTPYLHWVYNGVEQVVAFANADDAKACFQELYYNGIHAGFCIPEGYKELPVDRTCLLSDAEMAELKKRLDKMELVRF